MTLARRQVEFMSLLASLSLPCSLAVAVGGAAPDCSADLGDGGEGQSAMQHRAIQQLIPLLIPAHLRQAAVPGRLLRPRHGGHRRAEEGECAASPLPGAVYAHVTTLLTTVMQDILTRASRDNNMSGQIRAEIIPMKLNLNFGLNWHEYLFIIYI